VWDASGDADAVLWIGHATVLVRLGGKTILFDPLFDDYATPVPPVGPRRLAPPGIALAVLPRIDAILVSHDHYDHFEPSTIPACSRSIGAPSRSAPTTRGPRAPTFRAPRRRRASSRIACGSSSRAKRGGSDSE
jgi:L-ascorbate metabolism protein UlaG (beta-lactamase superfamily)